VTSFGRAQYLWQTVFMAHPKHNYDTSIQTEKDGHAAPDGPPLASKVTGEKGTAYVLRAASLTVLRGNISKQNSAYAPWGAYAAHTLKFDYISK
jgi:hypothetical protein